MSFERVSESAGVISVEKRGRRIMRSALKATACVGALLTFSGGINAVRGLDELSEVDNQLAADIHRSGLADIDEGIGDGIDDFADLAAMLEGIKPVIQEAADSAEKSGDEIANDAAVALTGGLLMTGSLGGLWILNRGRRQHSPDAADEILNGTARYRYAKLSALAAAAALTACSPLADRAAGATDAATATLPGDGLATFSSPLTDPLSARVRQSVIQDITNEIRASLPNTAEYAETIGFGADAVERMIAE